MVPEEGDALYNVSVESECGKRIRFAVSTASKERKGTAKKGKAKEENG
jgi:hypothetical protein